MNDVRIMLVDDHPIVREGYRRLIESRGGFAVVAEAGNAGEAYRLYRTTNPDITIMDLALPGPGGLEALRHIRQWDSSARILIFTMHDGTVFATKAFEAGAAGYVTKSSDPNALLTAIDDVLGGERAMSPDVARALAEERIEGGRSTIDALSPRETEILRMIAQGLSDEAIAEGLSLSLKTVQNNHYRIRAKLGAATDAQLVAMAVRVGLATI